MRVLIAVLLSILSTGCGRSSNSATPGVLDRLGPLPDANGNGLVDIPTPDGVSPGESIGIHLASDITRAEIEALAQGEIPAVVGAQVGIRADVTVDLDYANGVKDRLRGSRPIGPFDIAVEAACPLVVEVRINLVAEIPFVGDRGIRALGPYRFEREAHSGFTCGSVLTVELTINEDGQPAARTTVEPLDTFVLVR